MAQLTVEQRRAIAVAKAKVALAEQDNGSDILSAQTPTDLIEGTTLEGTRYQQPAAVPAPAPTVAAPVKPQSAADRMVSASKGDANTTLGDIGRGILGSAATVGNAIPGVSKAVDLIYGQPGTSEKSLRDFKIENEKTSGYQLGKGAADLALTAAPGMGAYRVAKGVLSVLPKAGAVMSRVAPAVAELGGQSAAGATSADLTDSDVAEGAMLGAGLGAGAHIVGKVYDIGKRIFEPAKKVAARHIHDIIDATDSGLKYTVDTLRKTVGMVPGEAPTAGMAAVGSDGGPSMPWLKTLNEGASQRTQAGKYYDINRANEQARLNVLEPTEKLGQGSYDAETGTPMPSAFKQIRSTVTDPMFQVANPDMVYVSPRLGNMMAAPEAQIAALRGDKSYAQAGANARAAGAVEPPPAIPMQEMGGPSKGDPFGSMGNQSEPAWTQLPMRSIDDLQRTKDYLTKQISDLSKSTSLSGADTLHLEQLKEARRQLTQSMITQSPAYATANRFFTELSAPQNQADVYHQLAAALREPGSVPGERVSSYLSAVENPSKTLSKAGLPKYQFLEQVIPKQDQPAVNALTASLRRQAAYNKLPNSRDALPAFLSPAEHIEQNAPPFLMRAMTLARHFLKKQAGKSDAQIAGIIDEAMRDPNRMADLIESLPPEVQRQATGMAGVVGGTLAESNR